MTTAMFTFRFECNSMVKAIKITDDFEIWAKFAYQVSMQNHNSNLSSKNAHARQQS